MSLVTTIKLILPYLCEYFYISFFFVDHKGYFQVDETTSIIRLTSSTIPPELFEEQRITLSIEATKARTVGANAVVIISLPAGKLVLY